MLSHAIWTVVAAACMIWYSTITIYVAWRGGFDIKNMLKKLDRDNAREKDDARR
jgi:hypothetical protein